MPVRMTTMTVATKLDTECCFRVLADNKPCHYGTVSPGIRLALFKVERNLYICLIHNLFHCLQN